MLCSPHKYHSSDQIMKTDRQNLLHVWVRGEGHTGLQWGNLKGDHFENPGVDGMIILKCIFERLDWRGGGIDWIDWSQDRNR